VDRQAGYQEAIKIVASIDLFAQLWSDRPMRRDLLRRFLVAVIAISVVALPAATDAVVSPSLVELTMADQADMPCCPCCNTQGDFKATACVLKCIAFAGAVLPMVNVAPLYLAARTPISLANDTLQGFVRAPPTHPPLA
jgi:hypothetical protein